MKGKRNTNKNLSLVDELIYEGCNDQASLKGKPNSSHIVLHCKEQLTNMELSKGHFANAMNIHSNSSYAKIDTLGNNTYLTGLTVHSMTKLNGSMILENHENYISGIELAPKHLFSINVTLSLDHILLI